MIEFFFDQLVLVMRNYAEGTDEILDVIDKLDLYDLMVEEGYITHINLGYKAYGELYIFWMDDIINSFDSFVNELKFKK